jgi:CBS domain-containing protein
LIAREVMTSPPITVAPDTPVSDVAAILLENRISAVPVLNVAGGLVGIVSEGDLLRRTETNTERRRPQWLEFLRDRQTLAAEFVKAHGRQASDVMSADVITVSPDTELADIASLLEKRRIKRVPVVDGGRVVGIVSRANLLHGLAAQRGAPSAASVRAPDAEIRDRVNAMLSERLAIDLPRVNVVVTEGVVFLWGTVSSEEQRRAIIVASEGVPGVTGVEDRLHRDFFPE